MDSVINVAFGIIMAVVLIIFFVYAFHEWVFEMLSEMRDSWHEHFDRDDPDGPVN